MLPLFFITFVLSKALSLSSSLLLFSLPKSLLSSSFIYLFILILGIMSGFSHKYTRRCFGHDYKSRCIYLITILKSPEAPPFSSIAPDPGSKKLKPFVTLTPLGKIIAECINRLCLDFPDVKVLCYIIMLDHVHIELFVTRQMDIPLGSIIAPLQVCLHSPLLGEISSIHPRSRQ